MPPSNWLSNSIDSYGLQHVLCNAAGFSSFQMAQMFPDCMGEVDVVSAAENIKRLLKLPYSTKSAGISMMVHRIENTLLIDDFDIHKYLLRRSDDDWKWMRAFIENIIKSLSEKDLKFFIKHKTRDFLNQKNLTSKFLYHSLETGGNDEIGKNGEDPMAPNILPGIPKKFELIKNLPRSGPILPEPNIEENLPESNKSNTHTYNRNVLWTFEDIRMLIGTDMPIFGGGTRPCISLKLRDMSKPINVLTGIDYWLDNLMCNVPEVVMCYHLDGIVQKYELVKTEDLPNLENSKFSPKIVRNVAQNILSFLKSNATKSGHTYWLFKGRNEDFVKLYDLTTLCSDTTSTYSENATNGKDSDDAEKSENPFTIPVAMLLYTVARNMKNSKEKLSPKKAGAIKALLDNCIQLLPKEKYPQIVTSSYYLLSDLHIPAGLDPGSPEFDATDDEDSDEETNDDDNENSTDDHSIAIKSIQETIEDYRLDENAKINTKPPPLTGSVKERCQMALKNIINGLSCLQYFETTEVKLERDKIRHEADNPKMAKSNQPIPLPYEPLKNFDANMAEMIDPDVPIALGWKPIKQSKKWKKQQKNKSVAAGAATAKTPEKSQASVEENLSPRSLVPSNENSWNSHLKILLLEKTCLTYATLAESYYTSENYGLSLRYFYIALHCQQIVTHHKPAMKSHKSDLLGRAGDCFLQFSKHWNKIDNFLAEFESETDIDKEIKSELLKDVENMLENDLPKPVNNIEHLMRTSCACYEAALEFATANSKNELLGRLGNARNELGSMYMNWTQDEFTKYQQNPEKRVNKKEIVYQSLAFKSYDSLMKGVHIFEEIKDTTNLAHLLSNMGRFMRLRAHIYLPGENSNDPVMMKKFYNEAFAFYNRALGVLGERKVNPELWDQIYWDLSTATFNLAQQLQDHTLTCDGDLYDIEIEVVDLLKKALKLCDVETSSSKQILYVYRSALINHR